MRRENFSAPLPIQISNSQASSPLFFAARGTPSSLLRPPQKARGWRAKWRVMQFKSHLLIEGVAPLGAPSRRFHSGAGPRFRGPFRLALRLEARGAFRVNRSHRTSGKPQRPAVSHSWQGTVMPPGGAPAPPGCRRSVRLLPAGAASDPANITLHDSALGGSDNGTIMRIITLTKQAT